MGVQRRFIKNLFTGELQEVWDDPVAEFETVNARSREATAWMARRGRRAFNPWDSSKDHIDKGLSLKPEEVSPERIAYENEMARKHGTGAVYDNDGNCHLPTRGSKNRELARPKLRGGLILRHQNNDAGFGDWAGR